jgi:hypothetical protein
MMFVVGPIPDVMEPDIDQLALASAQKDAGLQIRFEYFGE